MAKKRKKGAPETKTRGFRYAARPEGQQVREIEHLRWMARLTWNTLIRCQRSAMQRIKRGEEMAVLNQWAALVLGKEPRGREFEGLVGLDRDAQLAAIAAKRQARIAEQAANLRGQYAHCEKRRLATEYAVLRVAHLYRQRSLPVGGELKHRPDIRAMHGLQGGLVAKFKDASEQWARFQREPLRWKKPRDPVTLQAQIHAGTDGQPFQADKNGPWFADFSGLHPVLAKLELNRHREIPKNGTVKQIALAVTSRRTYAVFSVERPKLEVAFDFPARPGVVIGIDPGITPPATWAIDREQCGSCEPDTCRTTFRLKKIRRFQRRYDRQDRAANPDCFEANGTPIKGKRRHKKTPRMYRTLAHKHQVEGELADLRLEEYRKLARRLLAMADVIVFGVWRLKILTGERTRKIRNIHRKGYDAAISLLRAVFQDYASRSTTPKLIVDEEETGTTETCSGCGAETGPSGVADLMKRRWTCGACGLKWDRNVNAAINFTKRYRARQNNVDAAN